MIQLSSDRFELKQGYKVLEDELDAKQNPNEVGYDEDSGAEIDAHYISDIDDCDGFEDETGEADEEEVEPSLLPVNCKQVLPPANLELQFRNHKQVLPPINLKLQFCDHKQVLPPTNLKLQFQNKVLLAVHVVLYMNQDGFIDLIMSCNL
ncbi:uncharacterized protein ASPGLDRAFT_51179 [Aspergillus glaucus CBS 516.65]|uniref:Uncharacterized protein n=1 Tax=Aspergillus glaucus CBS 516.65 TaxID=1160497 RepID=A0A1L9V9Z6_ASPGL|nr:hypothetical protein ASPGLDRAFT_51179 [Aspergillus glaucus CBS 516.65]OJJ80748.1 hypothetical protein ASPGLDRAFT_51179 [Aspergillus glaucus CBS 516.65]